MALRLSIAAEKLEGQPMFKVLARVQELEKLGRDIIHFEIGDPDFDTPPNIVDVACDALRNGETHYVSSMGLADLREVVGQTTQKTRGFTPEVEQILVTPGANIIIYYAIRCLVNAGEEVIVPDPCFPTYTSVMKFCDVVAVRVPLREENGFRMDPDEVRQRISAKTRMIIMNSPHNPTGAVMTLRETERMADIAEEHNVFLCSDEVYARMIFAGDTAFSSPSFKDRCRERTIIINGFSKAFAMTGWRLGVAIGPREVVEKMGLLLQTTSSCVAPFVQRAGIEAIIGDQSSAFAMVQEYKERRDLVVDGLNAVSGIKCLRPGGAFYVFPNIKGTGLTSAQFADFALEKAGVALLPGPSFGPGGEGYVRLCYSLSKAKIREGIARLKNSVDQLSN